MEKIRNFLIRIASSKPVWGITAVCLGGLAFLGGMTYEDKALSTNGAVISKEVLDKVTDTSEPSRQVTVITDGDLIKKHSPVQFFQSFTDIKDMEDMNNFIVVYVKSANIRQVVVKDKNSGEIYCYECRKLHGDGYEITDSFIRKNKLDTADKMRGM